MVIVKIIGGLGNQMFQYAVGKSLALKNKTNLKLDIEGFKSYKLRRYMLDRLNINAEIATEKEIKQILGIRSSKLFKKYPRLKKLLLSNKSIKKERFFNFDKNVFQFRGDIYLDGYYQSEKYFIDIKSIIRNDLKPIEKLDGQNAIMAELINDSDSVSLHVRRGDYVSDPNTNSYHGICDLNYYAKAIKLILNNNPNSVFFIFSDDCAWARDNIKINNETYFIDFNGSEKNYEDIRLMSLCKHSIIANSSFSWWGAWLNNNPNKIVIAPKQWFANKDINTNDIIPESWIKI